MVVAQTPDLALLELKSNFENSGSNDVFILSMDLSYKTPEAMAKEDEKTLSVLTKLNHARTGEIDVDARRAAALLLMILRELGAAEGEILARSDSSEILGRRVGSGTSYAAVIYGRGPAGSGPEKLGVKGEEPVNREPKIEHAEEACVFRAAEPLERIPSIRDGCGGALGLQRRPR